MEYTIDDLKDAFEAGREYQEYKHNANLEEKSWGYTFEKWFERKVKKLNISAVIKSVCSRDEDCVERDKQTNDCKYKYECEYKKQTVLYLGF